ncbi:sialidase family protein [Fodinicola feengrottensis]|uniref:sialidase family protein n=1 Tax=Fodinicola feengrottensis TaxID=435914 RepID=UPI0013D389C2|nr:sialidase family protein [Fodinicola feengrottensis]
MVSDQRAYAGSRSLLVDDQTSTAMTAIACGSASAAGADLAFAAFPDHSANGFLIDILGTTATSGTTPVFHLLASADGSMSWYDGSKWNSFAAAGSLPQNQWSTVEIAVPSNYGGMSVSVGGHDVGTGGRWGTASITGITGFGFASTGTVPTGDRVFFDNVTFGAVPSIQTFETDTAGAVPTGCVTPAGKTPATVSAQRGYNSNRSLLINDQSTSAIVQVGCDRPVQQGGDLKFMAYPAALANGFLIDFNGTVRGFSDVRTVFHLAVTSAGGINWYDGGTWDAGAVAPAGTVPMATWSSFEISVPTDQSVAYVSVNGQYVGAGGPWGVREVTSIVGYGFASNGTPTTGDTVFLDNVGLGAADDAVPPAAHGRFDISPLVLIDQRSTPVQMPNTAVVVGQRVLLSYPAHTDSSATSGNEYAYSDNGGASWVHAQASNPMPNEASYSMTRLGNGNLLAVNYHTYMLAGNKSASVDSAISTDNGMTWTKRTGTMTTTQEMRPISSATDRPGSAQGGFVLVHSALQNSDGSLFQSAYGYYQDDPKYRELLLVSTDGGLNWTVRATVGFNPTLTSDGRYEGFCEGAFARAADGSLFTAMRIGGYLPMYASRSTDNGVTWSTPTPLLNGPGESTFSVFPTIVNTAGNTFVMVTGRPGLSLLVSDDGGLSWSRSVAADYQDSANGTLVVLDPAHLLLFGDRGANWSSPTPSPYQVWSRQVSLS